MPLCCPLGLRAQRSVSCVSQLSGVVRRARGALFGGFRRVWECVFLGLSSDKTVGQSEFQVTCYSENAANVSLSSSGIGCPWGEMQGHLAVAPPQGTHAFSLVPEAFLTSPWKNSGTATHVGLPAPFCSLSVMCRWPSLVSGTFSPVPCFFGFRDSNYTSDTFSALHTSCLFLRYFRLRPRLFAGSPPTSLLSHRYSSRPVRLLSSFCRSWCNFYVGAQKSAGGAQRLPFCRADPPAVGVGPRFLSLCSVSGPFESRRHRVPGPPANTGCIS